MTLRPFLDKTNSSVVLIHVESADFSRYELLDALPSANMGSVDIDGKVSTVNPANQEAAEALRAQETAIVEEAKAKNPSSKKSK